MLAIKGLLILKRVTHYRGDIVEAKADCCLPQIHPQLTVPTPYSRVLLDANSLLALSHSMQFIPPVKTSDTNSKVSVSCGTNSRSLRGCLAVYSAENVIILKDDRFCQISVRHDSV